MFKKIDLKKQKGFTLIELMIVVAIIGILAAIAIPQFAAYRIKAFNSAAESDLRNMMTAEEAAMADTQYYWPESPATVTLTGPGIPTDATGVTLSGAKASTGVVAKIISSAVGTGTSAQAYIIYTGHNEGNHVYEGDNLGDMYWQAVAPSGGAQQAGVKASGGSATFSSASPWQPM